MIIPSLLRTSFETGPLLNGSISLRSTAQSTRLNALAVDTRSTLIGQLTKTALLATIEVDVFQVEGVDMAGQVWKSNVSDGLKGCVMQKARGTHSPEWSNRC